MALSGLKKTDGRRKANKKDLDAVLAGSALRTAEDEVPAKVKISKIKVKFKAFTFSLTSKVSDDIDDLCLTTKKINRSDVVKAGVIALQRMTKVERKAFMDKTKGLQ